MSGRQDRESEWDERYASRDQDTKLMRRALRVRIFGPYNGDCSYILNAAARQVRCDNDYDARLCLEIPEVDPLATFSSDEKTERYNLEASLECLNRADFAVFVFMRAKERRFRKFGPRREPNFEGESYFKDPDIPQDLNSSVVLEYSKWIDSDPRSDKCLVIYEDGMKDVLGSLIHGLADREDIYCKEVVASTRGEAINRIGRGIAGHCRKWFDDYDDYLSDLVSPNTSD